VIGQGKWVQSFGERKRRRGRKEAEGGEG